MSVRRFPLPSTSPCSPKTVSYPNTAEPHCIYYEHFHRPSYAICESQIPKYIVVANFSLCPETNMAATELRI